MARARRRPALRLSGSGRGPTITFLGAHRRISWCRSPPPRFSFYLLQGVVMANPIAFKPITVDFKLDLQRRLEKAPNEHAAAMLQAWDVLEAAHEAGVLDLLHGMLESKDTIINTLSKYASQPEGVAGIRNLLTAAKILTEVDPELLERISKVMVSAKEEHK